MIKTVEVKWEQGDIVIATVRDDSNGTLVVWTRGYDNVYNATAPWHSSSGTTATDEVIENAINGSTKFAVFKFVGNARDLWSDAKEGL